MTPDSKNSDDTEAGDKNDIPDNDPVIIDVTPDEAKTAEPKPGDAVEATAEPEDSPVRPRSKRGLMTSVLLVVLVAVFAAGAVFAPEVRQAIPGLEQVMPTATSNSSANGADPALTQRLTRLEQQVSTLESTPAPASAAPPDLTEINRRLDDLAASIQALQDTAGQGSDQVAQAQARTEAQTQTLTNRITALRQDMGTLSARVSDLEQAVTERRAAEADTLSPMTIVALGRLRQAVDQGLGFAPALESVEQLLVARGTVPATTGKALETLEQTAASGVPTLSTLHDDFESIAGHIVAAESLPEDADWWDRTVAAVTGTLTIRQTGDIDGDDAEARVARAEVVLNAGDLDKAITEISGLEGSSARVATDWLNEAKARQAALAAVDTLEATLLNTAATSR